MRTLRAMLSIVLVSFALPFFYFSALCFHGAEMLEPGATDFMDDDDPFDFGDDDYGF